MTAADFKKRLSVDTRSASTADTCDVDDDSETYGTIKALKRKNRMKIYDSH